jgi:hypothetical protein
MPRRSRFEPRLHKQRSATPRIHNTLGICRSTASSGRVTVFVMLVELADIPATEDRLILLVIMQENRGRIRRQHLILAAVDRRYLGRIS